MILSNKCTFSFLTHRGVSSLHGALGEPRLCRPLCMHSVHMKFKTAVAFTKQIFIELFIFTLQFKKIKSFINFTNSSLLK